MNLLKTNEKYLIKLSNLKSDVFIIEYPAYVNSIDNAIRAINWRQARHTLDKLENLQNEKEMPNDILELRQEPNNPTCHPIYGRICSRNSLLLKFQMNPHDRGGTCEVVGVTRFCFRFREVADFQYPFRIDPYFLKLDKAMDTYDVEEIQKLSSGLLEYHGCKSMIPPPMFTQYHVPIYNGLKPFTNRNNLNGALESDTSGVSRRVNRNPFYYRSIEDEHPEESYVDAPEDLVEVQHIRDKLDSLFAKRPIWSSISLRNQFGRHERSCIKKSLKYMAYYYINGPWRHCWVKLGYNPKKTPESRIYQILELRSFFNRQFRGDSHEDDADNERSHILDSNINPFTVYHLFQYCDILEPNIIELFSLEKNYSCELHHVHGWWSHNLRHDLAALIKTKWFDELKTIKFRKSATEYAVRTHKRPNKSSSKSKENTTSDDDVYKLLDEEEIDGESDIY